MTPSFEMVRRVEVTQRTLDHFKGRPFAFGRSDCVRLAAFHLRLMGYRPALARGGSYDSALGARAALRRAGFADLAAAVDALLPRVPPASAIVGDIVQGEGDTPFDALGVALGNGRIIGFHEDAGGAVVMQMRAMTLAWRATPR